MYDNIKNPETGKYTSIYGHLGKRVLLNYLEVYQSGGASGGVDGASNDVDEASGGVDEASGGVDEAPSDTFVVKKRVSAEECRLARFAAYIGISPRVHSCNDGEIVLDKLYAIGDAEFTEKENEIFKLILMGAMKMGAVHADPGPSGCPGEGPRRNVMKDALGKLYLIDWGDVIYTTPKLHIYNTLVVWGKFWVGGLRCGRVGLLDNDWIVPYLETIKFGLVSYNVYMTKTNIDIAKRQIYELNQRIRTLRTVIKMTPTNAEYKAELSERQLFIGELQLALPNMEKAAETALSEFNEQQE